MQRTVSVLLTTLLAGLLSTGCPEKKVEKEEPATPTASDKNGAEEKQADDEHGEEPEDKADDPTDKRPKKRHAEKKAGADKDQGGW